MPRSVEVGPSICPVQCRRVCLCSGSAKRCGGIYLLNQEGATATMGGYTGQMASGIETMKVVLEAAGRSLEDLISTEMLVTQSNAD